MNYVDMSIEDLRDKYERIKTQFSTILYGQIESICFLGWNKDIQVQNDDDYYTRKTIADKGNSNDMPQRAQIAFLFLLSQTKTFDLSKPNDFIVFETLFYELLWDAYNGQRYSAQSEKLIDITAAEKKLDEKAYKYLSIIYEILQIEYKYWLNDRNKKPDEVFRMLKDSDENKRFYPPTSIGTEDYWKKIKNLASSAHDLVPIGELANRMMLISEARLRVDGGYYIDPSKDVGDPFDGELLKYLRIRKTFISDCFSNEYADQQDGPYSLCWLWSFFPYLEDRPIDLIAPEGKIKEDNELEMEYDELEMIECYDKHYYNIMMYPSYIYIPDPAWQFFRTVANLEKTIEELRNKNEALKKALEEKHSIINAFSHRYKNMRTTALLAVARALLATGNADFMKHGRTLLLEFSTKETLTKDAELLQLQFEDKIDELQKKIRESMYSSQSKPDVVPVTINQLLSDAFRRCMITLIHDRTPNVGAHFREGFHEKANFTKKLLIIGKQFEEELFTQPDGDMFAWFNKNVLPIQSSFSPAWNRLVFEQDNYAAILITGLLSELTANVFKYADKSRAIAFLFGEAEDTLSITIRNTAASKIENSRDGGKGLLSNSKTLGILNKASNIDIDTIRILQGPDNYFETTVILGKSIFQQ